MNLGSIADVDQYFRPILLTSLIIGMVILILLEKRKVSRHQREEVVEKEQAQTLKSTQDLAEGTKEIEEIDDGREEGIIETRIKKEVQEGISVPSVSSTHSHPSSSSSCSSSGSEEEPTRPLKVSRRPKKKHACKGSPVICASKRKVTAVTVVMDSQEEKVQESLEDLAGEIRSHGVTCTVHPAFTHLLPSISTEPSHLLLLFGTSSEGCRDLQGSLRTALGGDAALPPPQPFLYSVTCRSAAAAGDVYEAAQELSASLASCGGAEWLPVTCISTSDEGKTEPPVMGRQQFAQTVMEKLTKPAKKCCGTSCGSKTVDIEDLASSLLLPRTAVTS